MSGVAETIDPDYFAGPYGPMLHLDSLGIYGTDIWLLYKDICGESIPRTLAVMRGVQLGIVSESCVLGAIADAKARRPFAIKPDEIWEKVCKRLPKFQKNAQKAAVSA